MPDLPGARRAGAAVGGLVEDRGADQKAGVRGKPDGGGKFRAKAGAAAAAAAAAQSPTDRPGKRERGAARAAREKSSRIERRVQCGIDCADVIHFKRWQPLGEYHHAFTAKNATVRTLKLRYRLPSSRVFYLDYPETMILSPGMSISIPVSFRPMAAVAHDDKIEFTSSLGSFTIPIIATLPKHRIDLPAELRFGTCALQQTATLQFVLKNTSDIESHFAWSLPNPNAGTAAAIAKADQSRPQTTATVLPFDIVPQKGSIQPGQQVPIKAMYTPKKAGSHLIKAICTYGDGNKVMAKSIELTGVGKFGHVQVYHKGKPLNGVLNVGQAFVGQHAKAVVKICNPTMVRLRYKIRPQRSAGLFMLSRTEGELSAKGGTQDVVVTFSPRTPNWLVTEAFQVFIDLDHQTASNKGASSEFSRPTKSTCVIELSGEGLGPVVEATAKALDFGSFPLGEADTAMSIRSFQLVNRSECPATFQFQLHANSVFSIEPGGGTIASKSFVHVTATFQPPLPIIYHRKVHCRIENGPELDIDFIGTGYSEAQRPPPYRTSQLDSYRERIPLGLHRFSPEDLAHMLKVGVIHADEHYSLRITEAFRGSKELAVIEAELESDLPPAEISPTEIDFGTCSPFHYVEGKPVTVRNNTTSKLVCCWIQRQKTHNSSRGSGGGGGGGQAESLPPSVINRSSTAFYIEPQAREIVSGESATFRIYFKPTEVNALHELELECFAYCKSMRSFRLVTDETSTPTWCLPVRVFGNTLQRQSHMGSQVHLPKGMFEHAPCFAKCVSQRIFRVENKGDSSALADFRVPPDTNLVISPSICVIPAKSHQLVRSVFVAPKDDPNGQAVAVVPVTCLVNGSAANSEKLAVQVRNARPSVSFEPTSAVIMAPTLVGLRGTRTIYVRNNCDMHVMYRWAVPQAYHSILALEPRAGVIPPHWRATVSIQFRPEDARKALFHIPLHGFILNRDEVEGALSAAPSLRNPDLKVSLAIAVTGQVGKVHAMKEKVQLDCVLIMTPFVTHNQEVMLCNPTDCDVAYLLRLQEKDHDGNFGPPKCMRLRKDSGHIPAKSRCGILIEVFLKEQRLHECKLQIAMNAGHATIHERVETIPQVEWKDMCDVTAQGVFPILEIAHIEGKDSSSFMLHRCFNVERINDALRQGNVKDVFEMTFPPKLRGSEESMVVWVMRNGGQVPLKWYFCTPQEAAAVEVAEQSHGESVFTISPKAGVLEPGELQELHISCSHANPGLHEQEMQLQVKSGSSCDGAVSVMFSRYNVPFNQGYIFHAGQTLEFGSVWIGRTVPLVHAMQLVNPGTGALSYTIDTEELDRLETENYGFPVFQFESREGVIPANGTVLVPWMFHPIEEKEYVCPVAIHMKSGNSITVTLTGRGTLRREDSGTMTWRQSAGFEAAQRFAKGDDAMHLLDPIITIDGLPMGAIISRMVAVNNPTNKTFYFEWMARVEQDCVRVHPQAGSIPAGGSKLFRVYVRGTPCPWRLYHCFDCVYSATPPVKRAAVLRRGSYNARLTNRRPVLPSIADSAECKRLELLVVPETVSRRNFEIGGPKHLPVLPRDRPQLGGGAAAAGTAAPLPQDPQERQKVKEEVQSILEDALSTAWQEINYENWIDRIHNHEELSLPDLACPPEFLQDVMENLLASVFEEIKEGKF